jgi:ABC-type uncharacterized transport system involved in gliding motility auxiliary subunit
MPTVIAGLSGVGRGQDRQALIEFVGTLAQAMGPEALAQFIQPEEFIRRLATASGIESLGLVKTSDQLAEEKKAAQEQATQSQIMGQMGQLAKSPMAQQMMGGGQEQPPQGDVPQNDQQQQTPAPQGQEN